MPDWDAYPPYGDDHMNTLASVSPSGILVHGSAASAAWPSANLAIYVPVRIGRPAIVYRLAMGNGATAGGNIDIGLYTWGGTRLVSSGSTARVANEEVIANVTDTPIGPGRYWLALACDGTSNITTLGAGGNAGIGKMLGLRQQASAFALPATATFATSAQSLLPMMCAYLREP